MFHRNLAKGALVLAAGLLSLSVAQAQTLIVYSPQGTGERGDYIAAEAKAALGVDIQFVGGGGGAIFDRLIAEKNNPQADVVFGMIQPSMYQLKTEGLFEAYAPSWAAGLDDRYTDVDGQFHMFWQTPIVMAYNSAAMTAEEAPKSWLDLVKPEYQGKYVVGNLVGQTTRVVVAGLLWRFADPATGEVSNEGWDFMRTLFANARPQAEGADFDWKAVADGEMPIVLSWYGGIVNNATTNNIAMTYIDAEGGSPFVYESIAIMKGTDDMDTAKRFVDWFGSPTFMAAYAEKFGNTTPAHPEALAMLPASVQEAVDQFQPQPIDWAVASPALNDWLATIQLDILQ